MIEGTKGRYHADPGFHQLGILKIEDLYKQQLRVHAWNFFKDRLPENQAAMLSKVRDTHQHGTRAAKGGMLSYSALDDRSIGYRLPREWQCTPQAVRESNSLKGMKNKSKQGFLTQYGLFKCEIRDCFVCRNAENASG